MSRGLGPWPESYSVGCKGAPTPYMDGQQRAIMQAQMSAQQSQMQYDYALRQQQAMMGYGQISAQAQQMAFMGNMTRLYGNLPSYKRTVYPATRKGHRVREWNAVTQKGYRAKERFEIAFWVCATLIGFCAIIVPVAVKSMTFFWTWALT